MIDLFILNVGQKVRIKIIIIKEKLPTRWPESNEKIILITIKKAACILYFGPKNKINKAILKNKIPIL